ncbi:reverse transcriptase domain-containing protein, partial [Tanacetum coccineum]
MSDKAAWLNDLSYIPLNNKQNESTQGDIGGTSNKPTQTQRIEFEELYASANKELYPICDFMIPLDLWQGFHILRPLIDDLKKLWKLKGVKTIDIITGKEFKMRAMLLWTINDLPARSSLSGWSGE